MNRDEIASCGICCAECGNYRKNANCQGCRVEPEMVDDCPNRSCAIERGYYTCAECPDFVCDLLKEVYAMQKPLCQRGWSYIQGIREYGLDEWLKRQNEKTGQ